MSASGNVGIPTQIESWPCHATIQSSNNVLYIYGKYTHNSQNHTHTIHVIRIIIYTRYEIKDSIFSLSISFLHFTSSALHRLHWKHPKQVFPYKDDICIYVDIIESIGSRSTVSRNDSDYWLWSGRKRDPLVIFLFQCFLLGSVFSYLWVVNSGFYWLSSGWANWAG